KVQVRAADGGEGDLHDRVARVENGRVVDHLGPDAVLAAPGDGFHGLPFRESGQRVKGPGGRVIRLPLHGATGSLGPLAPSSPPARAARLATCRRVFARFHELLELPQV